MIDGKIRINILQSYVNEYKDKKTGEQRIFYKLVCFDPKGFNKTNELTVSEEYVKSLGGFPNLQKLLTSPGLYDCDVAISFRQVGMFSQPNLLVSKITPIK